MTVMPGVRGEREMEEEMLEEKLEAGESGAAARVERGSGWETGEEGRGGRRGSIMVLFCRI